MYTIGYNGVICVEAGGPTPGIGCAGRKALDLLKQKNFEEVLHPDVVFYDVLGDVVCGALDAASRKNYADTYMSSLPGEQMAIYVKMNLI